MQEYKDESYDLSRCFREAKAKHETSCVLIIWKKSSLFAVCRELGALFSGKEYANELYQKVLFPGIHDLAEPGPDK